jgi:hypothetical protein
VVGTVLRRVIVHGLVCPMVSVGPDGSRWGHHCFGSEG